MADFRLGASQGRFLVLGDRRPCGEAKTDDRPVRWTALSTAASKAALSGSLGSGMANGAKARSLSRCFRLIFNSVVHSQPIRSIARPGTSSLARRPARPNTRTDEF